jgi:single-stranded-DNA-specific exonuclease
LDDLNRKRQDKVKSLIELAKEEMLQDVSEDIILSFHSDYHQGVVGLVASRLTEEYYRPSVVGEIKGDHTVASCRSIPEFHITEALDQCADLFERHGGHEMAAGFTIKTERIPELKERLSFITKERLDGKDLRPTLYADMEVNLRQLPANILESIQKIEPTGQANPEVVFLSKNVQIEQKKKVGDGTHLSMRLRDGTKSYPAIAFRQGNLFDVLPEYIDILYTPTLNEFNGSVSTQLHIIDIQYK